MLARFTLPALLVASLLAGTAATQAQYYEPYRPAPPSYDYDDDDDRPPPPRRYDRAPRWDEERRESPRRRFGEACVTSRGTCEVRPAPIGTGCRCYIEGFGPKRGAVEY